MIPNTVQGLVSHPLGQPQTLHHAECPVLYANAVERPFLAWQLYLTLKILTVPRF